MASVDDRIVRMEFDNAAFERNVNTTLSSLANLDKALKFDGAKAGLTDLQGLGDKFSLGNMGTHIESVSSKFLALSTIAVTALSTITSKAMDAGMRIVKSFALDGITQGFGEFELKMGSIQTIMAGTGASLEEVNKKLNELNAYSDKTIYSFKDMTSNIGKFTNAGIDLDTAVASIQGVANVAAVSGANTDDASRAMYNFAQALSKGSVQLIDWKSIENANMATAEFKQQLIDSAIATGDLTKKGEEYVTSTGKAVTATGDFNGTLTDGWLTTKALTDTLGRYSDETTAIGKKATAAATEIKTFTSLIGTVKESIGSGWAQSFEILIGNFEESKQMFTGLGKVIGDFVGKNADARNNLLTTWKAMGGRSFLFVGLVNAFKDLMAVINPLKEAFRDIFPPMTALTLYDLSRRFAAFMEALKPGEKTVENLHRIFKGFFAILEIGWEIIKQGVGFIGDLIGAIGSATSGSFLSGLAKIGDFFVKLNSLLVEGEGVKHFFDVLGGVIAVPIALLGDLKDKVLEFFGVVGSADLGGAASDSFGRVKDRLSTLSDVFDKITALWEPVKKALLKMKEVFDEVMGEVGKWAKEFVDKLVSVFQSGDFNKVLDMLNVGLFGGLLLVMNKFINKGVKINATLQGFFGGGLFEKIGKSFDQLTGVLQSMQMKIKAEALQKIAIAIGMLTASIVVLSLIDSAALTKSLTAMAVGFGELMGAFAILNSIDTSTTGNLKFTLIAAGMIVLSTAILILAAAIKIFSTIDSEQLGVALAGMGASLLILMAAIKPLSQESPKFILAAVGLIALSTGLVILAGALKLFSMIAYKDMVQGFVGIGAGLLIIAAAMNLMPNTMILSAAGLVAVGVSLGMIAGAVKIFATMSWGDIGKGLVAVAGALVGIGLAMNLMPTNMILTAPALIAVGIALTAIAKAVIAMSSMSWGEIAKGLTTLAASLVILALGMELMSGAIPGAIALGIIAASLSLFYMVLKEFAKVSFDDLLHGLAGIAAVFLVLGVSALALEPAIPALIGLGAALLIIGGAFALFGLGVSLVAEGLSMFISLGPKAGKALVDFLTNLGKAIPALAAGLGQGLVEMAQSFLDGAAPLIDAAVSLLDKLLDGLDKLIPKALKVIAKLLTGILDYLTVTGIPKLIEMGLQLIVGLLKGIESHIGEVVNLVGEIITNFVDALAVQVPSIIESIGNLFIQIFKGVSETMGRVAGSMMLDSGIMFIKGFMAGISQTIGDIWPWLKEQFNKFIDIIKGIFGINSPSTVMMDIGVDIITGLLNGIIEAAVAVKDWFMAVAKNVLGWIGDVTRTLWSSGTGIIGGLLGGIVEKMVEVTNFYKGLGKAIIGWIGDAASFLKDVGGKIITGLFNGIKEIWKSVGDWFSSIADLIKYHIPNPLNILYNMGKDIIQGLWNGIKAVWNQLTSWLSNAVDHLPGPLKKLLGANSPSTVFMAIGKDVILGFNMGLSSEFDKTGGLMTGFVDESVKIFENSVSKITESLGSITEFQPTITPVLDLTEVKAGAQKISDYMATTDIPITTSYDQASTIATSPSNVISPTPTDSTTPTIPGTVKFEQNIYAPSQLSTSDIYKQTRNQIAMAKEALSIP